MGISSIKKVRSFIFSNGLHPPWKKFSEQTPVIIIKPAHSVYKKHRQQNHNCTFAQNKSGKIFPLLKNVYRPIFTPSQTAS